MKRESDVEIHTRLGNDPSYWIITARVLFAASKAVKSERERAEATLRTGKAPDIVATVWTELMLTAFCIECLIKAIWLKQGHQLARDGKYVSMTTKERERHDLVKLCRVAGIEFDQREAKALQQISDIAKSIGRYPIALHAEIKSQYDIWAYDDTIERFIAKLTVSPYMTPQRKEVSSFCADRHRDERHTIQIVRPLESIAETQPQAPTALLEIVGDNFPVLHPS